MRTQSFRHCRVPDRSIGLRIGGCTIALATESDVLVTLPPPMRRFRTPVPERPDVQITARRTSLSSWSPRGQLRFDSGEVWKLYANTAHVWIALYSRAFGHTHPYQVACMDPEWHTGEVWLDTDAFPAHRPVYPLAYPLDELILLHWLAQGRGCVLHAAAVCHPDGGILVFAGPSGAGKTTVSRLWHAHIGTSVLSDDRVILRPEGSGVRAYGTPWHGEGRWVSSESGILRAILILEHGPQERLTPLHRAQAVAECVTRSFFVPWNPEAVAHHTEIIDTILARVPCYRWTFRPVSDSVLWITRTLAQR